MLFLSDGVVWHSDDRRNSVAAGVQWAVQNSLQGLVLESAALRGQPDAAVTARQQGLQVGNALPQNSMQVSSAGCSVIKVQLPVSSGASHACLEFVHVR